MTRRYSYHHVHGGSIPGGGVWRITDTGDKEYHSTDDAVVFECPFLEEHWGMAEPPAEVRAEYERLLSEVGQLPKTEIPEEPFVNLVEMIQSDDADCAWDQPCAHGHRVESHAVYCHNEQWLYSPRKCHRSQSDPEWRHQDCPGFLANPLWKPTGE